MRLAVIGLGVQGRKRRAIAGDKVVAVVDPVASGVDFQRVEDVPLVVLFNPGDSNGGNKKLEGFASWSQSRERLWGVKAVSR